MQMSTVFGEIHVECPDNLKLENGYGESIVADKCDSHWTDVECQNPEVYAEYHWGQFGHKVLFLFCAECYIRVLDRRENSYLGFFKDDAKDRGFEFVKEEYAVSKGT